MPRLALLVPLLLLCPSHLLAALTWHVTSEAIWHGNITNSDRPADRLSALQLRSGLMSEIIRLLPGRNIVSAGLGVGLELWPKYQGLDSLTLGPSFGWAHKFGLGDQAWVLGAATSSGWVGVRESHRSGLSGHIRLEVRKRWGDSWQFFLGTERARHDARILAFSHSGRENYLRGECQLNADWSASMEIRQRAGIVVSYTTPPRPDLVQAGKILTLVGTFERDAPLLAYYFPADTRSLSLDITRALGPAAAAFLKFEYRDSTHLALRYINQRIGVGVVRRF